MATTNGNRSITLTAKQHETLLVAALDQISTSASIAEDQAAELRDVAPSKRNGLVDDTQLAFRILREDLDAMDALGWPGEREDR